MNAATRIIPLAIGALLMAPPALSAGPNGSQPTQPILYELELAETQTLLFMHEEERLARDIYIELGALWQASPFNNIALSEQTHMEAIERAISKYGLADPSDPAQPGSYGDQELDALHAEVTGSDYSYPEALAVGALIEELDIQDLQVAIAATENPDLQKIYNNLLRGSRNHLRAFVAELERQGVVYNPQKLDEATFDAILSTPRASGGPGQQGQRGNGSGNGNGSGQKGPGGSGLSSATNQPAPTVAERLVAGNGNGKKKRQGGGSGDGQCNGRELTS